MIIVPVDDRPTKTRGFYKATPSRQYRLGVGVRLADAAAYANLSLSRASEIERFPDRARPGELEALRAAVELLSQKKPEPAVSATEPGRR